MDELNGRRVVLQATGDSKLDGLHGTIRGSEFAAGSGIWSASLLFAVELDTPPALVFVTAGQFQFLPEPKKNA